MQFLLRVMREGCGGHEVALPFDTLEKSVKRIAEAIAKPEAARPEHSEGHAQIIISKTIHNLRCGSFDSVIYCSSKP